jgi:NADPH:quinone reductase-like Zn-dependent oxidoreductase
MGIVPENEHLLGLEGSGVIRRLGKSITSLKIGQRVIHYDKGAFANRIQLTAERVYPLPDSLSFEVETVQAFVGAKVLITHVGRRDDAGGLYLLNI